mgnify:CR=1 FL=1|tara:strand:+ start:8353 stop:12402 length:4050 start_codon:yes stop_codon:yes gene_type:complete
MQNKNNIFILILVSFFALSCTKQTPTSIEDSYTESIEGERLRACSRMNLFENLFEHQNQLDIFDCTEWSKKFPKLRTHISLIPAQKWNHFLRPLSQEAFNDREVLRQFIGITQKLDEEKGLDDLGQAITVLSDTNFYDGMNELFQCADSEKCTRTKKVSKQDIKLSLKSVELIAKENTRIHKVLTQAIYNTISLPADFGKRFSSVLNSPKFKSSRVQFLDTVVSFITKEKSDVDGELLSALLSTSEANVETSIYGWINSNLFNLELIQKLLEFRNNNPNVLDDIRSVAAVRQMGLKCSKISDNTFYINLDHHLLVILKKLVALDGTELTRYLEEDIALHQMASQACPEFRSIKINLPDKEHELSVVRLKKSLVDLMGVPGVLPLVKIISRSVLSATGESESLIGALVTKYGAEDYLGKALDFTEIINTVDPTVLSDYVAYLKAFKPQVYNDLAQVSLQAHDLEFRSSWPALGKVWFFFTNTEKDFLFNYVDKHFNSETNFKPLFEFYLNAYTVLLERIPAIIHSWKLGTNPDETFESLKAFASQLHGKDVLAEFSEFFSRDHILKVMELFINGERLTAWADHIRSLLPANNPNRQIITFDGNDSSLSSKCLTSLASTDLNVLMRDFPKECRPFDSQVTLKNLKLMSEFGTIYKEQHGSELYNRGGLLDETVLQSIIIIAKNIHLNLGSNEEVEVLLKLLKSQLSSTELYDISETISSLLVERNDAEFDEFRSKMLLTFSEILSDQDFLRSISRLLSDIESSKSSGQWNRILNRDYPNVSGSHRCESDLNGELGGIACPSKDDLIGFLKRFTDLLTRRNDTESPIAARLFLKALDSSAGVPIPLRARETHNQNLSIKESLAMFYDLSDRSKAYNTQDLLYQGQDTTSTHKTTVMERIEVVIRDVNFDENYLGAHYKNSVAKSFDYLKVVESKYKMFKICVKAGFCGKFMNRNEKRMAKNAVEAFPSLMDVQLHGLNYGDYMKALLGSVVGSSSKVSQISTIVKFKKDGDGFNIPWIQTKRQLRKHNGKILSELAGISAFSNLARWTRDRFARTPDQYREFIASPELSYISSNLLRGFDSTVSDETLIELIKSLSPENSKVSEDVIDLIDSLSYKELRKLEDVLGDLLIITSSFCNIDQVCNWDKGLKLVTWGIGKYEKIRSAWTKELFKDVVFTLHPIVELISQKIVSRDPNYETFVKKSYGYINKVTLSNDERIDFYTLLTTYFNNADVDNATRLTSMLGKYIVSDNTTDQEDVIGLKALSASVATSGLAGLGDYVKRSAYKRSCSPNGELVICKTNDHFQEPFKILKTVTSSRQIWNKYVVEGLSDTSAMATWMTDSLDLISLEPQRD